jgi:hypothetical protein
MLIFDMAIPDVTKLGMAKSAFDPLRSQRQTLSAYGEKKKPDDSQVKISPEQRRRQSRPSPHLVKLFVQPRRSPAA